MVFLPVVERELRVAARRRGTYRVRFYTVLVMSVLFGWVLWEMPGTASQAQTGQTLFVALACCGFAYSLLIGLVTTTDCVSCEKRDGTLGLLFLTDLKGYDVIAGKLVANSIHAFYGLIGVLPVLGIPLLLGGVSLAQFIKVAILLQSTIAFSLAAGIFVSTCSRSDRKALFFTLLLLLAVTFLPVLVLIVLASNLATSPGPNDIWPLAVLSPVIAIVPLLEPAAAAIFPTAAFWASIMWLWALALSLAGAASVIVPRTLEEKPAAKPSVLNRQVVLPGLKPRRPEFLDINPYCWLALGGETSQAGVWLLVIAVFVIWLIAGFIFGFVYFIDSDVLNMIWLGLNAPLAVWIAGESSRRFVEDRRQGNFELLLSTPLTERQIIPGQWMALQKQFGAPLAFVALWELFLGLHQPYYGRGWSGGPSPILEACGLVLYWFLGCVAVASLAMWIGLRFKSRIRAIVGSLALVLLGPCIISYALFFAQFRWFTVYGGIYSGPPRLSFSILTALNNSLPLLFIVWEILLIWWSTRHLSRNFRALATER